MQGAWTLDEDKDGAVMTMLGPWSSEALAAAKEKRIRRLELNHAKGWRGSDLSFLGELAGTLTSFSIIDFLINDIRPVNDLINLEFLDVNTYCKTEIRFDRFPLLRECSIEWRRKASSLFDHRGVEVLFINKLDRQSLSEMSGMRQLKSLVLASPRIRSLGGLENLANLETLGVHYARGLESLAGLGEFRNLQHLEINNCRRISDVTPIGRLSNLRTLQLCGDSEISSLRPLAGLRHLEELFFFESTNIVDGDLSVLLEMPALKDVAFMDRDHYSHKRAMFPQPPRES